MMMMMMTNCPIKCKRGVELKGEIERPTKLTMKSGRMKGKKRRIHSGTQSLKHEQIAPIYRYTPTNTIINKQATVMGWD